MLKDPEPDEPGLICPCGSVDINVMYSQPLTFYCYECKKKLYDANDPGVPRLSMEEARSKRPIMFGLPACEQCKHGAHEGECKAVCKWCEPHVYRLMYTA
jgi:hypothetical protein